MKTAMQELIEYTENLKSTYDFSFDKFFTKANELLEKEKQQRLTPKIEIEKCFYMAGTDTSCKCRNCGKQKWEH